MYKATSSFAKAKNIAMALTLSFAATTMVTACGGDDDSSDATQRPEAEMPAENQNNMTDDNNQTSSENIESSEDEAVESDEVDVDVTADAEQSNVNAETEETDTNAASDDASTDANASENGEAETHVVNAQGLQFAPLVVKINPGDSVAWRNMSTHNSESIDGLIPEDAEKWNSPMSENYERTFTQEGIYVYKCTPHFGTGMGGAIIVGEPVNLEEIKNADAPGPAGRLVREAVAEAESM